ncbi:MAG TPA: hypothetical protein PKV86_04575 [Syntrophobacteraceae bacterium]|nr:hypothetical protein [Syntrophobacteraceae bacterium]
MFDQISQLMIGSLGILSIFFIVKRDEDKRKIGMILGLLSQPFWLYTAITHTQWGILAVNIGYTIAWGHGVYNYWISDKRNNQKTI